MVGNKSLGCKTCKRRKVRCDERRPICANCERSGRFCPGPLSPFLVTSSLSIVKPFPKSASHDPNAADPSSGLTNAVLPDRTLSTPELEAVRRVSTTKARPNGHPQRRDRLGQLAVSQLVPDLPLSPAAALATEIVNTNFAKPGYELSHFGAWVRLLVPKIGHNTTLDAAARCLVAGHREIVRSTSPSGSSLRAYHYALSLLREDLESHGHESNRPVGDLLGAATLLSTYELLKQDAGRPYIAHAGGISALLQSCGPERIRLEFESALFLSQYGLTVMTSIFSGADSFLAAPAWEEVRRTSLRRWPEYDAMAFDTLSALAMLPPILRSIRALSASAQPSRDPEFANTLQQACTFRQLIHNDRDQYERQFREQNVVITKSDASLPDGEQYHFSTIRVASRFCMYWGAAIIAARILRRLHIMVGDTVLATLRCLDMEIHRNVERILKSLPYVRQHAPFGALFMTFPLQIITPVVDEDGKRAACTALSDMLQPLGIKWEVKWMQLVGEILTGGNFQIPYTGRID